LIKAVIFDFDGVLFDSERFHFETLQQVLQAELGVTLSLSDFLGKYFGKDDPSIFRELLESQGKSADSKAVKALIQVKVWAYHQILHDRQGLPAIVGVAEFLAYLKAQGLPVAVFSNGNREEVLFALERLDGGIIKPYFQFVTTIDDINQGKPNPEGYLRSAELLGVDPAHCLVIEDSIGGIRAGKAADMKVVGLTTTHESSVLNAHADFVAESYQEVESWVHEKLR